MKFWQTRNLSALSGIAHGFFGSSGGVSQGIYASLNAGSGTRDARENVIENRRRICEKIGVSPEHLCTLYQIHSPDVITVTAPWTMGEGAKADAMVTNVPGIALGILTADCAPVLFADAEAGVIGAAHAGWKGAAYGVIENTVAAMEKLGAKRADIAAALGPCIAQVSYEVGQEFYDAVMALDTSHASLFAPSTRDGHYRFDLTGMVRLRCEQAGIQPLETVGVDTYASEALCFSYRSTTHRGESDYGRELSVIALKK